MLLPAALDPVLLHMLAALLAIVLLGGAWQKGRDLEAFAAAVEQYALLPGAWAPFAAACLVALEVAAGLALLPLATRPVGAALSLALLAVVTLAVAINLLRGRYTIDCGCGGPEGGQQLSWALVARNAGLAVAACLSVAREAPRDLVWLDGVTLIAGTLALYGVYAAANHLIANRPQLARLKG